MAILKFSLDLVGMGVTDALLSKIDKATNVEEILDEAEALLLNRIRRRFLQQVDPDGVPWVPSKASFRRLALGQGGGTLFDTGTLFHSIQASADGPGERSIGTDVPYAPIHQLGLFGNVPRPFLGFSDADVKLLERRISQRISEKLTS